jgi:hypothetical protein
LQVSAVVRGRRRRGKRARRKGEGVILGEVVVDG